MDRYVNGKTVGAVMAGVVAGLMALWIYDKIQEARIEAAKKKSGPSNDGSVSTSRSLNGGQESSFVRLSA